jgi:hypothetical protein
MKISLRDAGAGLSVLLLGVFFLANALRYGLGTAQRPGPGFFPTLVATLAVLMGVIMIVQSFKGSRVEWPRADWRAFAAVLAAVAAFAVSLSYLGLLAAVFFCVCLCSLASPNFKPAHILVLAAGTAAAFWLVFVVGLGLRAS